MLEPHPAGKTIWVFEGRSVFGVFPVFSWGDSPVAVVVVPSEEPVPASVDSGGSVVASYSRQMVDIIDGAMSTDQT